MTEQPTYATREGEVVVSYRGDLIDPDVRLVECSDCHSAVPWDSFQAHIAWHGRILHVSPAELERHSQRRGA